jgi:hypothetical protein
MQGNAVSWRSQNRPSCALAKVCLSLHLCFGKTQQALARSAEVHNSQLEVRRR